MRNTQNRLFLPVAIWHTPRGDVELQREINPARLPADLNDLRQLIDADAVEPAIMCEYRKAHQPFIGSPFQCCKLTTNFSSEHHLGGF